MSPPRRRGYTAKQVNIGEIVHSRPRKRKLHTLKVCFCHQSGDLSLLKMISETFLPGLSWRSQKKTKASGITGPKISTVGANPSTKLPAGNGILCPGQRSRPSGPVREQKRCICLLAAFTLREDRCSLKATWVLLQLAAAAAAAASRNVFVQQDLTDRSIKWSFVLFGGNNSVFSGAPYKMDVNWFVRAVICGAKTFRIGAQNVLSGHFPLNKSAFPDPAPRLVGILSVSKGKAQITKNETMITYLNPDESKWTWNIQFALFSSLINQQTSLVAVIYAATSILVDTYTTWHEIWWHLRQVWCFTKRKKATLICLFPTINGNESKFLLESFWFCRDLNTHHALGTAAAEFHPQTLKRRRAGPSGGTAIVLKFSLQFASWSVPFPILFGISDVCLIRDADTVSRSSSLIQSVFPFVFLMCALFAVVTGATERLLISLSLLMLTSHLIVLPFQPYIPRSPPSASANYGYSEERGLTLPYLLPN